MQVPEVLMHVSGKRPMHPAKLEEADGGDDCDDDAEKSTPDGHLRGGIQSTPIGLRKGVTLPLFIHFSQRET